jgi:hypothetical protein
MFLDRFELGSNHGHDCIEDSVPLSLLLQRKPRQSGVRIINDILGLDEFEACVNP